MKKGDIGRPLYVATSFDLSANTNLEIKFTSPDGLTKFTKSKLLDGVTAPAVDSPSLPATDNFSGGVLPASTYMLYTTDGTEFDADGDWQICTAYTDGTPKYYQGDDGILTIDPACD